MTRTRAERIVADVGFAEGPVCLPGIYQSVTNRIVAAIEAGLAKLSRCSGFGSDSISVLKKVFLKIWAKWALCPGVWLAISTVARRLEALLKIERDPDLGIKTIDAERHGGKWVVRAGGG